MTVMQDLGAGFTEPVFGAQTAFRHVLDAMAHPGRLAILPADAETPEGLDDATTAVALTLFDFETRVWLDPALRGSEAARYLRFHCGCPLTEIPADAAFAIVSRPAEMPRLGDFSIGSDQYPDMSATLVIQTAGLADSGPIELTGPGIEDKARVGVAGLPDWFWPDWAVNHGCFPTGIDLILTSGAQAMCLPRSVKVQTWHG